MKQVDPKKPHVLLILDGWGLGEEDASNAIYVAQTPNMDRIMKKYPHTKLWTYGEHVGLPDSQAGNSEAGHMNIGAGRIAYQDSVLINKAIDDGRFFKNSAFLQAVEHVHEHKSRLHIMGLLSGDQSGHSYPFHLYSLLKLFEDKGIKQVFLHLFTDGRDISPHAAPHLLAELQKHFKNGEVIATIMGRYYGMERNKRWDITERAYDALVLGKGYESKRAEDAIRHAYERGETDEFIQPTILTDQVSVKDSRIQSNDAVVFFNLRSDRARQLAKVFVQDKFTKKNPGSFHRKKRPKDLLFVAMTDFGPDLGKILTAFPSVDLEGTLPMALKNRKQLYIAESEKYAHITYFLNGGYADPVGGEDRVMIPSPNVTTYDQMPEMSTYLITQVIEQNIRHNVYDVYVANFANADMVGHTGDMEATVRAVEAIDECIGRIEKTVLGNNGILVITADHGNADEMIELATHGADTAHSVNPVPFILVSNEHKRKLLKEGNLSQVAPTFLELLCIEPTKEMTSKSLIK